MFRVCKSLLSGLTIVLTGNSEVNFFLHGGNATSGQNVVVKSCSMGKKSSAIFGGELGIHSLPDTCPT
eukprot:3720507-Ditylum_brightwellii.AAC.1